MTGSEWSAFLSFSSAHMRMSALPLSVQWNEPPKAAGASAELARVQHRPLVHLGHSQQRLPTLLAQQLWLANRPDSSKEPLNFFFSPIPKKSS